MSVLSELVRERREWPERCRTMSVRHHQFVVAGEAALAAEAFIVICLYQETILTFLKHVIR